MADLYKIQYANNTLTYPGWNGYCSYTYDKPVYYSRYEIPIFSANSRVSAGNCSMPITAFDRILIGTCWETTDREYSPVQYTEFIPASALFAPNVMSTTADVYKTNVRITFSNNYTHFETPLNTSNAWCCHLTNGTGAWTGGNNTNRSRMVREIIGVKYQ